MGNLLPDESAISLCRMGKALQKNAREAVQRADRCLLRFFERPGPRGAANGVLRLLLLIEMPLTWLDKPVAMLLAGIQMRERKRREKRLEKDR